MILTLNCGSSSLKYALFDNNCQCILKGYKENITSHEIALQEVINGLSPEQKKSITRIGHRVAHGGEHFTKAQKITPEVIDIIKELAQLAPLHNPANLMGIKVCQKLFPNIPNIAVFDTAFHQTIPAEHFLFAIPHKFYTEDGIRKYGFHGMSHQYLRETYKATYAPKGKKNQTIITCHLGNGASITLIKNGKSITNSL